MRFANFATVFTLGAAACFGQGVAARVEQLSRDVATLKTQQGTAPRATVAAPAAGSEVQVNLASGEKAARLYSDSDGGNLGIYYPNGRTAVRLTVNQAGGEMRIYPDALPARSALSMGLAANKKSGGLWVYDTAPPGNSLLAAFAANKPLATVTTDTPGTSGLVLVDGPGAQFRVNGTAKDYAEAFEIADRGGIRPGSVVAEAPSGRGLVLASGTYNPAVVGVISGAGEFHSGMVIGTRSDGTSDLPVATGGQVFVRVSAEGGDIAVGDLLVSSGAPGVAMRGADAQRLTGTVVGKALQPWSGKGEGLIRMLVMNR